MPVIDNIDFVFLEKHVLEKALIKALSFRLIVR